MKKPIKELSGETLHSIDDAIKSVFKDYNKQEDKVMARPTKKQSLKTLRSIVDLRIADLQD